MRKEITIRHECMGDSRVCALIEEIKPILEQHSAKITKIKCTPNKQDVNY